MQLAPTANAFTISPEYRIPPSEIIGTFDFDDIFYIVEANEAKDLQKRVGVVGYPTLSILEGEKVIYNALGEHKIMELL